MYDLTSKHTFLELNTWYDEAQEHAPKNTVQMLIGNKRDLEANREVTVDMAQV